MNFKTAIAFAFIAAASVPAFAGNVDYSDAVPTSSKVTRADVVAEVLRARAAGELDLTEAHLPFSPPSAKSTVTRAQVRAELIRARAAGELDIAEASPTA